MSKITKYYNKYYNEDNRLDENCDNRHLVERTVKQMIYFNNIPKRSEVLDISAGTGVHSLFIAKELDCIVSACDLVKKHTNKIKENSTKYDIKLKSVDTCDARNLPYKDNSFNCVLIGGAIYHLKSSKDKLKTILEAKRVCKDNGLIFIDFLPYIHGFSQLAIKHKGFLLNNNVIKDTCDDNFSFDTIKNIKYLIKESQIDICKLFSTDIITRFIKEDINKLSKDELDLWINFIYNNSDDESIVGLSEHAMVMCRNRKEL